MKVYDLIIRCENQLGWRAPAGVPIWKARAVETAKLTKAMDKAGVGVEDVALALELSRRRHDPIDSPVALLGRIDSAQARAADTGTTDLEEQIQDAIEFEMSEQLPGWQGWVSRLSRCAQQFRAEVFTEWSTTRLAEVA